MIPHMMIKIIGNMKTLLETYIIIPPKNHNINIIIYYLT